jgi:hypothetical protein
MFKLFKKKKVPEIDKDNLSRAVECRVIPITEAVKPEPVILTATDAFLLTEKERPTREKERQDGEDYCFLTIQKDIKANAERGENYIYISCYMHFLTDKLCKRFTELGYTFFPTTSRCGGITTKEERGGLSWASDKTANT